MMDKLWSSPADYFSTLGLKHGNPFVIRRASQPLHPSLCNWLCREALVRFSLSTSFSASAVDLSPPPLSEWQNEGQQATIDSAHTADSSFQAALPAASRAASTVMLPSLSWYECSSAASTLITALVLFVSRAHLGSE